MIYDDILQTIGRTPVVRLRNLSPNGCDLLIKLEGCNPAGSIKDRPALHIIDGAERSGQLKPGGTIVESTSGNFGKSLAMIGAVRGYRVVLVVDPKTSPSVINFCRACGAQIDTVDVPDESGGYQKRRVERVRELLETLPDAFWPDQYNNPGNPRAHAETTAAEIVDDVGDLDVLVAAVSTGGHVSGLARALKRAYPSLQVVAVDAYGSSIFGTHYSPYLIRGIGLSWQPGNLDLGLIDWFHRVADSEAFRTCRCLAKHEGIFVGESAGAVVFAGLCRALAEQGRRILAIAPDGGINYVTESYDDRWVQERIGHRVDPDEPADYLKRLRSPQYRPIRVKESVGADSR
jgi:cystathionine beta-synthase/cysteine synthase A